MDRTLCNLVRNIIFFLLMMGLVVPAKAYLSNDFVIREIRFLPECLIVEQLELSDDEKLLQELWTVSARLYSAMIETTALYFTGMLVDSGQFQQQITLELGKHLLYAGKVIAQYIPKLLKNEKIPISVKIKRCAYVTSFLVILIIWMQEYYKPYRLHRRSMNSYTDRENFEALRPEYFDTDCSTNMQHRPRPYRFE